MENILICLAAPLLIAFLLSRGETRRFIGFYIFGLLLCLLSAYINSYATAVLMNNGYASLTAEQIVVQFIPICEEAMKALPVFVFVAVAAPGPEQIVPVSLAVGLGFATFENICYITLQGAGDFIFVLIRGFSAGVMHAVCAAILGYGFVLFYRRGNIVIPGAFALLSASSTFHGIYNLLVAGDGGVHTAGYVMPLAVATVLFFVMRRGAGIRGK